jgi:hypothetical protein
MTTKTRKLIVLTISVFPAALAIAAPSDASAAPVLKAALLPRCPTTDFPKPQTQPESLALIGTAVAGVFLEKAVDAGIAALKKTLNPEARSVEGDFLVDGLYAYRIARDAEIKIDPKAGNRVIPSPDLACLVVASGEFGPPSEWTLPFEADERVSASDAVKALSATLGVSTAPDLYMEAVRQFSPDLQALAWRPVRVYVGKYLNESFWAGSSRGLKVEVKFRQPGKAEAFASFDYSFDSIKRPFSLGPSQLKDRTSGNSGSWVALPGPSDHFKELAPSATGVRFDPFTLNVRIVESPKPYQVALMFADSVDSQKDAIKTALKQAAIPSLAKEADLTAKEATNTAISTYLTDYQAAVTACDAAQVTTAAGKLACVNATAKAQISRDKASTKCTIVSTDNCGLLDSLPAPTPNQQASETSLIAATRGAISTFIEKRAAWVTKCKADTVKPEGVVDDQAQLVCDLAKVDAKAAFDAAKEACTKKTLDICANLTSPS